MAQAGSLIFELAADVSRLRVDLDKANKQINDSLRKITANTAISAVAAGANFALQFARSFADNIQRSIDDADAIGKLSQRVGVSTEVLSAMRLQAQSAGSSLDAVTNAMRGWSKASLEIDRPTSNAAAALRALGLSTTQLKDVDPATAMKTIAQAMSGFQDGADKVNVARALFGKVGDELIPMLNEGARGFDQWTEKATELGAVIDTRTARAAEEFNNKMGELKVMLQGAWLQLAQYLLPTLVELVDWFRHNIKEGGDLQGVLHGIAQAANIAAQAMVGIIGGARAVGQAYTGINNFFMSKPSEWGQTWKGLKDGIEDARRTMDITADTQRKMGRTFDENAAKIKANAGTVSTLGQVTDQTTKKKLAFGDAIAKAGKAAATAKVQLSDYQRMLQQMTETLRTASAAGDQMTLLETDPRFLQMKKEEQDTLRGILQATLDVNRANEESRKEQERQIELQNVYDKLQHDQRTNYENIREAAMNLADPLRQIRKEYEDLAAARAEGSFEGHEDAWAAALDNLGRKAKEALDNIDPMKKKMDELKQAVEGFGRQASDAFVDFIFNTGESKRSFGEMVSAMLKDIARLLVYRNVFEPLVGNLNNMMGGAGSGGGLLGFLRGLLGRASGGPVNANQPYRVNESPLRTEFFVPNVPGAVRTSEQVGTSTGDVNIQVNVTRSGVTADVDADTELGVELAKRINTLVRQVIATERRSGGLLSGT